jgi:hypothetical protein
LVRSLSVPGLRQIIVHNFAQAERQVGKDVDRGHDLEHGQFRNRCQGVRTELQRGRPGPGTLYRDILKVIFDQLTNSRRGVDMWNDLKEEIWRR